MYKQNCIHKYFQFLHNRLNWLFHILFLFTKIFCLRNNFFCRVHQKIVSNTSVFESKNKLYKMIQFTFFYYTRFCNT